MAEKTDAEEADSTTKFAFVCGIWSAGFAALLYAYPLVFCRVQQFLFPCFEVLVQGTSPPRTVSCRHLPGCGNDAERLRVSHADVVVSQLWTASGSHP